MTVRRVRGHLGSFAVHVQLHTVGAHQAPGGVVVIVKTHRQPVRAQGRVTLLTDLLDAEGRRFLEKTPLFVPHARIAENARSLGLGNIILTEAADAGLVAGLLAYNWSA